MFDIHDVSGVGYTPTVLVLTDFCYLLALRLYKGKDCDVYVCVSTPECKIKSQYKDR
jgi:hypothetical protein